MTFLAIGGNLSFVKNDGNILGTKPLGWNCRYYFEESLSHK
jgi:hypothetical protein